MKKSELDCKNCDHRNAPECYSTCEHYRRFKERNEAIRKSRIPSPAEQYNIDNARVNADISAKKKRK